MGCKRFSAVLFLVFLFYLYLRSKEQYLANHPKTCLDSLSPEAINDDYCDCEIDASDELRKYTLAIISSDKRLFEWSIFLHFHPYWRENVHPFGLGRGMCDLHLTHEKDGVVDCKDGIDERGL